MVDANELENKIDKAAEVKYQGNGHASLVLFLGEEGGGEKNGNGDGNGGDGDGEFGIGLFGDDDDELDDEAEEEEEVEFEESNVNLSTVSIGQEARAAGKIVPDSGGNASSCGSLRQCS